MLSIPIEVIHETPHNAQNLGCLKHGEYDESLALPASRPTHIPVCKVFFRNIAILCNIIFAIETMSTLMSKLISLLKIIAAYFLMVTLVWSFTMPLDHIPHNRSTCSLFMPNSWEFLACRLLPGVMITRWVSGALFMYFLPGWVNGFLDGWASAFVSWRILRATYRGVRDPMLDRLIGRHGTAPHGSPEAKREVWARHNTVLDVLENTDSTAASDSGVHNLNDDEKQQLDKNPSVDSTM
ncbi:hypothetical protein PspLS_03354 [Pyricularia sp. CBS 133598]|nr:hypothetical protein PspLS_03354 [Pyricularia sp. CBS 133598]